MSFYGDVLLELMNTETYQQASEKKKKNLLEQLTKDFDEKRIKNGEVLNTKSTNFWTDGSVYLHSQKGVSMPPNETFDEEYKKLKKVYDGVSDTRVFYEEYPFSIFVHENIDEYRTLFSIHTNVPLGGPSVLFHKDVLKSKEMREIIDSSAEKIGIPTKV